MNAEPAAMSPDPFNPESNAPAGVDVVLGLGITGLSCARYLVAHGRDVLVLDSRERPPGIRAIVERAPGARVRAGSLDVELPAEAARLIVSPGLSLELPIVAAARDRGLEVVGDVELFARAVQRPVLGVTGSNGKSTVTTMLAAMAEETGLRVLAGGNLGVPALDLLSEAEPDVYVLELSSFQLECTRSLRCAAAAVLNLSADHIDRHGTIEAYAEAKARIYEHADHRVFNRDDPVVARMIGDDAAAVSFGLDAPREGQFGLIADREDRPWLAHGHLRLMPADELRLPGRHNVANALAALALGAASDWPIAPMLEALRRYRGLPHRMRRVCERRGIVWINDSKATNVGAAVAAVSGLSGGLVLIAGGDGKGADFAPLATALPGRARGVVLIGRDREAIAAVLEGVCPTVFAEDMDEAVRRAADIARPGDTVLLSPACASYDMYTNYAARGEAFVQAVGRLDD
jgi:UDP-N-acetylmuramoylalanine--D-glutamate ligase